MRERDATRGGKGKKEQKREGKVRCEMGKIKNKGGGTGGIQRRGRGG